MNKKLFVSLAGIIFALLGSSNLSAGVIVTASGNKDAPSIAYTIPGSGDGVTMNWEIGTETAPEPIAYDPNQGPWAKTLTGIDGSSFTASEGILAEWLVIDPNFNQPSWTDWHGVILTDGWTFERWEVWVGSTMISGGYSGSNVINITFDPQQPGTELRIFKELEYGPLGGGFTGVVEIEQYPTVPEPTTLALMGLGLAGIGYQRRKWNKAA